MMLATVLLLLGLGLSLPPVTSMAPIGEDQKPAAAKGASNRRLTDYRDDLERHDRLRDVELDGYSYCLQVQGTGSVLVLLHGLGGSLYDWRHVVDDLSAKHRVIAVDLLGAGESSKPSNGDYSVFAQARRVKGLLDHLGIPAATLIGNSYGGGVALAFAQYWPDRVERLVLIDTVCYAEAIPLAASLTRIPGASDITRILPVETLTGWVLRGSFAKPERLTSEEIATYAKELQPIERRVTVVRMLQALLDQDPTEFQTRLRSIDIDSLILWGAADDVIPPPLGRRLAEDLPRARLVDLEAGHMPNQECPSEVTAQIEAFLAIPAPDRPRPNDGR